MGREGASVSDSGTRERWKWADEWKCTFASSCFYYPLKTISLPWLLHHSLRKAPCLSSSAKLTPLLAHSHYETIYQTCSEAQRCGSLHERTRKCNSFPGKQTEITGGFVSHPAGSEQREIKRTFKKAHVWVCLLKDEHGSPCLHPQLLILPGTL